MKGSEVGVLRCKLSSIRKDHIMRPPGCLIVMFLIFFLKIILCTYTVVEHYLLYLGIGIKTSNMFYTS